MRHKVLIVEDNETLNVLIREALQEHGFECSQALDGEQALAALARVGPDAVVLDLNIPKVHGTEVLRQIKRISPFTVVVVLTGHGSDRTATQALRLGADDYLTKPLRCVQLAQVLRVHIERAELQRGLDLPHGSPTEHEAHHLSQVFFHAPTAIVHIDPDLTISAVNRAASRLLACAPEELVGQPVADIVPEEVRAGWVQALQTDATSAKGYEGEVHMRRGAEFFPAHADAVEGPEAGHIILAIRDLSRQKALEKRYYESKKLASLGRVVEGVAHEVRNPLIAIGGFARKLLGKSAEDSRERSYLGVIVSEVERLEHMVTDIENYVQFSHQHRSAFAPVSLQQILADSIRTHVNGNGSGDIRVAFQAGPDLPAIFGDRALIAELFGGLVENAVDAMPGGGDLSVSLTQADSWIRATVRDTGVGIAPQDLEEIFDPFFTSKTQGAGLGLAKAYLIVEEHAGTIDFESTVDRGTTCTVNLPVDRRKVMRGT